MISIIIPTYNRKDLLTKAIKSIDNQLYEDKEIIIIDDNSTDNYKDILNTNKHLKIKYIKNKITMGPGYSRKLGLSVCSGKFVIFMDMVYVTLFLYIKKFFLYKTDYNDNELKGYKEEYIKKYAVKLKKYSSVLFLYDKSLHSKHHIFRVYNWKR